MCSHTTAARRCKRAWLPPAINQLTQKQRRRFCLQHVKSRPPPDATIVTCIACPRCKLCTSM
eukprot:m.397050 g.397050  ORF g.397050 m.397050 type:complete len:62 (+) comp21120_c2_seq2:2302-2487(+)